MALWVERGLGRRQTTGRYHLRRHRLAHRDCCVGGYSRMVYRRSDYTLDIFTETLLMILHNSRPPLHYTHSYMSFFPTRGLKQNTASLSSRIAVIINRQANRRAPIASRAGKARLAGAALGVGGAHGRRGAALAARAADRRAVDVGVAGAEARRRLRVAPVEGVGRGGGVEVVGL